MLPMLGCSRFDISSPACYACGITGAAEQLRDDVAEKDKRIQELMSDVGTARAYKAETDMITDELATQRKRYSEITSELAKCKFNLENETLAKSSALSEKEGLWEVHERLVAKSARLQTQLKDAEDECGRLQEQSAERSALHEKLKHLQAERDDLVVQNSKSAGEVVHCPPRLSSCLL